MTHSVSKKTLEEAFQSVENFEDFLDKFTEYLEYTLIMGLKFPGFEMSFEEYKEEFSKET